MQKEIVYSYFGEKIEYIDFIFNNKSIQIDLASDFLRNQVIILHNTSFNNQFFDIFGQQNYENLIFIEEEVSFFKIIHPLANIQNVIFEEQICLKRIVIKSFINKVAYQNDTKQYRTIFILVETKGERKENFINVLANTFNYLDELGFIISDKKQLDNYLQFKSISTNLLEPLETSDLSEDLSERGLMYIVWGFRPSYYKIIVTEELNFNLPIGTKVYETGYGKFASKNTLQSIIEGNSLANIFDKNNIIYTSFNNENHEGFSIKFYVSGRISESEIYEALNVYIHIELLNKIENVVELDQVDSFEEFNNMIE